MNRERNANGGFSGENNPNWKGGKSKNKSIYRDRFQAKYPAKAAAHKLISKKIQSGALKRLPCENCGATEDVHAHHDDYTKPLEIRWLCRKHHQEWHKTNTPIYHEPSSRKKKITPKLPHKQCSFCHKAYYDVFVLISGPAVFICDECIDICTGILANKRGVQ